MGLSRCRLSRSRTLDVGVLRDFSELRKMTGFEAIIFLTISIFIEMLSESHG